MLVTIQQWSVYYFDFLLLYSRFSRPCFCLLVMTKPIQPISEYIPTLLWLRGFKTNSNLVGMFVWTYYIMMYFAHMHGVFALDILVSNFQYSNISIFNFQYRDISIFKISNSFHTFHKKISNFSFYFSTFNIHTSKFRHFNFQNFKFQTFHIEISNF